MYVHIFGYLVNKLEIRWVYLSPIEKTQFNSLFQTKDYIYIVHKVKYNVYLPLNTDINSQRNTI